MTARDVATELLSRACAPIPVPFQQKKPVIDEWQKLRITRDNVSEFFNGAPMNVAVMVVV